MQVVYEIEYQDGTGLMGPRTLDLALEHAAADLLHDSIKSITITKADQS